ncbi:MAG: CocE/NonD family hydrolase [Pseudomonadota bacterium]
MLNSLPSTDRMTVQHDVMVPMRDGVRLATDIYLPAETGAATFPVILERTPYGKHLPSRSERGPGDRAAMERAEVARYFVEQGYAVIYQDCRGRYASEGRFVKYVSDAEDGYDTCAWILAQPWSDGRIGTKGLSYAAHTQAALGSKNAPGVLAMVLDSGGFSNAYHSGIRQGGAFEMKQVTWAIGQAMESEAVQADPARLHALRSVNLLEWFGRVNEWGPGNSPLSAAPEYENYVFEQWREGAFGDYWRRPGLFAQGYYEHFCKAASMHISSWYDPYARSACENFIGLVAAARGPACLILGPWTHGNRFLTFAGDVDFGAAATLHGNLAPDFLSLRLHWFDMHLKRDNAGRGAFAPVRLFIMGGGSGRMNAAGRREHGGRWRDEQEWPIVRTRHQQLFLHASGQLTPTQCQGGQPSLSYTYDPNQPTATNGGAVTSGEPLMYGGGFDQGPASDRGDMLSFQTEPLEQDTEVTGSIRVHLWVSSDCCDTDFTFKLIDVAPPSADYPGGYALNLTDGILRMRYRDSWETPTLMVPGKRYQIVIEALPTSNLFKRGHRMRVDIASSNFPKYDPNPNTGAAEGFSGPVKVACNTIHIDAEFASYIVLPIVPAPRTLV